MKFILPEQMDKYTLSEKYILKEAGGKNKALSDGLSALFSNFQESAKNTNDILKNFLADDSPSTIASKFLETTKEPELLVTSETTEEYSLIRAKLKEYLGALEKVLKKLDPGKSKYTELQKVSKELQASLQPETATDEEKEKIVEQAKHLFNILKPAFEAAAGESTKYSQISAQISKLTKLIDENSKTAIEGINGGKSADLATPIKELEDALNECINQLNTFIKSKDNISKDATIVQNLGEGLTKVSDQIESGIKKIIDIAKLNKMGAESQSVTGEWGQRLKNAAQSASTFAPVFKLFAQEVLGAKDTKTAEGYLSLNINNAIMSECSQLGYSTQRNPFLAFLATPLCQKLVSSGTITAKKYGIIHNAFIGGQSNHSFDANTLRGTGIFGKADLIFCENFWAKGLTEMQEYMQKRQHVLNLLNQKTPFTNDILTQKYGNDSGKPAFFADLMYSNNGALFTPSPGKTNVENFTLLPIEKIDDALSRCFNEAAIEASKPEAKQGVADKDIETWLHRLPQIEARTEAVLYLIIKYMNQKNSNELLALAKTYKNIMDKPLPLKNIKLFSEVFDDTKYELTPQKIVPIITTFADKGGLPKA